MSDVGRSIKPSVLDKLLDNTKYYRDNEGAIYAYNSKNLSIKILFYPLDQSLKNTIVPENDSRFTSLHSTLVDPTKSREITRDEAYRNLYPYSPDPERPPFVAVRTRVPAPAPAPAPATTITAAVSTPFYRESWFPWAAAAVSLAILFWPTEKSV